MAITKSAKDKLESRIKRLEDFIAEKGVGSSYLQKARKTQRNLNVGLALGGLLAIAGLTIWALSGSSEEE